MKMYKEIVSDIIISSGDSDIAIICGKIDRAFEAGKISWNDHEQLYALLSKVS